MHTQRVERARELRKNMTKGERILWSRLRDRQVAGSRFRRQVPIGPYIADFLCHAPRLVVEIDGETHELDRDDRRDAWLAANGYRVIRFGASEVHESLDDVIHAIYVALTSEQSLPTP
ncbi:MAG: endonuclease domain-containing protein, partial [Chloroflexi bacterium]